MKLLVLDHKDKNVPSSVFVKDLQNYLQIKSNSIYNYLYGLRSFPHFFERIVVLDHKNIWKQDAYRLFNLLAVPGVIICPANYKHFFTEGEIKFISDGFIQVSKKNNVLINIPNWFGDNQKRSAVDFICVVGQRVATTSIINNLGTHPEMGTPPGNDPIISEPHFYDRYWYKGVNYYPNFLKYNKK